MGGLQRPANMEAHAEGFGGATSSLRTPRSRPCPSEFAGRLAQALHREFASKAACSGSQARAGCIEQTRKRLRCVSGQSPAAMRLQITSLRWGSPSPASPAPCGLVKRIGSMCTDDMKRRCMLRLLSQCLHRCHRRRLPPADRRPQLPTLAASQPPAAGPAQSWSLLTAPGTLAFRCVALLCCGTASH